MSILNNTIRHGNFSSSNMWKLLTSGKTKGTFGAPALTYISEKVLERRLGRSLDIEKSTRATLWGHFMEMRVHDLLPLSYKTASNETLQHPTISYWVGSPDCLKVSESVVGDIKAWEPKAFAQYVDMLSQNDYELFKKEYPKEFWQLMSNAELTGSKFIEAIPYMPYESELEEIREMAQNYDGPDPWKYRFIAEAPKAELPYLPDGGYYKNLNIFRFEVKHEDIELMTATVERAGALLRPEYTPLHLASTHDTLNR